jgi:hypothetical protein
VAPVGHSKNTGLSVTVSALMKRFVLPFVLFFSASPHHYRRFFRRNITELVGGGWHTHSHKGAQIDI